MFPSARERERLAKRKTHRRVKGAQKGSMASLHDLLVGKGFSLEYEKGSSQAGRLKYSDHLGAKAVIQRVEKGQQPRWLPKRTHGGVTTQRRTAQMPDVWQLIMNGNTEREKRLKFIKKHSPSKYQEAKQRGLL